jgi:hypothetical protein
MNMTRMVLCSVLILNDTALWGMDDTTRDPVTVEKDSLNQTGRESKDGTNDGIRVTADKDPSAQKPSPEVEVEEATIPVPPKKSIKEKIEDALPGEVALHLLLEEQTKKFVNNGANETKEERDARMRTATFLETMQRINHTALETEERDIFSFRTARKIGKQTLINVVSGPAGGIAQGLGQTVGRAGGEKICEAASWTYDKIESFFLSTEEFKKREAITDVTKKGENLRAYSNVVSGVLTPYVGALGMEGRLTGELDQSLPAHTPPELKKSIKEVVEKRHVEILIKALVADGYSQEVAEAFKIYGQSSGRSSSIIRELQEFLEQEPTPPQNKINRPAKPISNAPKDQQSAKEKKKWTSATKTSPTKVKETLKSAEEKKKSDITIVSDKKDDGSAGIPKPVEPVIGSA